MVNDASRAYPSAPAMGQVSVELPGETRATAQTW